ncbi:hypothetical protein GYH30_048432 [Glycine max]|uniref:Uncharacterized protein n=1 Tax=Glycine max TaxID=3847 RepID=A0A0R0FID6_SOYBN|nr:hypothetical protein GYH30_048432 [Glycine max]
MNKSFGSHASLETQNAQRTLKQRNYQIKGKKKIKKYRFSRRVMIQHPKTDSRFKEKPQYFTEILTKLFPSGE